MTSFARTERIQIRAVAPDNENDTIQKLSNSNTSHTVFHVRLRSDSSVYFDATAQQEQLGQQQQQQQPQPLSNYYYSHPLLSPDALELLQQYQATRISIQVASVASSTFGSSSSSSSAWDVSSSNDVDEDDDDLPFRGPAGVTVSVDFLLPVLPTLRLTPPPNTEHRNAVPHQQQQQQQALMHQQMKQQKKEAFYELLQDLVGPQRRILTAPLGTTSMQRMDLHRYMESSLVDPVTTCTTTSNNNAATPSTTSASILRFTAILPMEGAHSAFSTEGVRAFLNQASGNSHTVSGIWSNSNNENSARDSAATWARWMLGSGPSALEEAEQWTASTTAHYQARQQQPTAADSHAVPLGALNPARRGFWIDWQASPLCHSDRNSHHVTLNAEKCRIQTQYGLQYAVNIPPRQKEVSIRDIIPVSNHPGQSFLGDTLADASVVEFRENSRYQWRQATAPTTLATDLVFNNTFQPCFLAKDASSLSSFSDLSQGNHLTGNIWNVQYHAQRFVGQAYRGVMNVALHNRHPTCGSRVNLVQTLPAVHEPVWQTLKVAIEEDSTKTSSLSSIASVKFLPWTKLDKYNVDFRADGTLQLSFEHTMPKQSTLQIWFEYDPSFLSIERFPGDANRGFEMPPVRATFRVDLDGSDDCHELLLSTRGNPVQLYSNALLLLAPLPDMSMPFNVISLTCTLYAFVVGSLLNLLIKKVSAQLKVKIDPENAEPMGLIAIVRAKLKTFFTKKPNVNSIPVIELDAK